MCHHGVLLGSHGKNLVKFGTSFDAHTFQIGASHKKDHSFQKEMRHFGLQSSVTRSFHLDFFHGKQSRIYPRFDFLAHFRSCILYLSHFSHLMHIKSKLYYNYICVLVSKEGVQVICVPLCEFSSIVREAGRSFKYFGREVWPPS